MMTSIRTRKLKFARSAHPNDRTGVTLIEILVVIGIISMLIALLMPAVQSAREAARRISCRNNLKQISLGFAIHEEAYQRLPSNGWGYRWVGNPDRGTDRNQPGGWIYNLLPVLEQEVLRRRGKSTSVIQQRTILNELMKTSVPILRCPTRSGGTLGPAFPGAQPLNADPSDNVAKSDYAVNEGDFITNTDAGPASLADGDSPTWIWTDVSNATGICFLRSEVRFSEIRDGLSNVYLAGEKYVSLDGYDSATDLGYDQSWLTGVDLDIARWTNEPPLEDRAIVAIRRFGSAHLGGFNMAFCDGTVRQVSYRIDAEVHRKLGNRRDGGYRDLIAQ